MRRRVTELETRLAEPAQPSAPTQKAQANRLVRMAELHHDLDRLRAEVASIHKRQTISWWLVGLAVFGGAGLTAIALLTGLGGQVITAVAIVLGAVFLAGALVGGHDIEREKVAEQELLEAEREYQIMSAQQAVEEGF